MVIAVVLDALVGGGGQRRGDALAGLGRQRQRLPPHRAPDVLVVTQHVERVGDRDPEERAPANEVPGQRHRRREVGGAVVVAAAARLLAVGDADGGVAEGAEDVVALPHRVEVDGRRRPCE